MSSEAEQHNVVVTRIFEAPAELVWRAWSDGERVMRWWGPTGWTCPLAQMDFRKGGTSLVCMRAPAEYGGMEMYNTWTYSKIEPNRRIEFTLRFTDQDGRQLNPADIGIAGVPAEVYHVITLEAAGHNLTEMTVTEYGYASEQARDLSQAGLEQCLDKMAASFK
jgi:uncharacterized protein YndB with AHSA1/START domain